MEKDLLLIIDMQKVYTAGGAWACEGAEEAARRLHELVQSDEADADIIFTRFLAADTPQGVWQAYNIVNEAVNADEEAARMLDIFAQDLQRWPLYTKSVYSSLAIPEVLEAAAKAKRVVVAGVVAECCVLSTVLALIDAGIPVVYLTDGVAGQSRETAQAVELVLAGLEPLHVVRQTIAEYIGQQREARHMPA